jgi:uncharacterized OB-fold protein
VTIEGNHLGMSLSLGDQDHENRAYFGFCAEHRFHLQRCDACELLRYPPSTGCPWCGDPRSHWVPVEGRGTVHSYTEVHHAIHPAFRQAAPYAVLLVELDTQRGQPSEHEALRVLGNLALPDGTLAPPEMVRRIGIGTRVRMVFTDVAEGLSLPQWAIDDEAPQPAQPWRYPGE